MYKFLLMTQMLGVFFSLEKVYLFFFSVHLRKYFGDSEHIDDILKPRIHIKNCSQVSNLVKGFSIVFPTTGLQQDFGTLCHGKWEMGDWVPRPGLLRQANSLCC